MEALWNVNQAQACYFGEVPVISKGDSMKEDMITQLTGLACSLGAQGVWIVRGAKLAGLAFSFEDLEGGDRQGNGGVTQPPMQMLQLAEPHELIIVMRFERSDGKPDGIENC
jgi:hypothetical protein